MTVSVTDTTSLGAKLVQDTEANSTAADNTTGGAGILYGVEITNPNVAPVYFKLADAATATPGTTAASVVLVCNASSTQNVSFVSGLTFSTGFSHWCVTAAAESNTTNPDLAVTARYVTS